MNSNAMLYPAIAMFAMTFSFLLVMGLSRVAAVMRREQPVKYYVTYDVGEEIPRLRKLSRHVQNHFEVPTLFYIGIILSYVSGSVTPMAVNFAWAYVAARVIHSVVHLGHNNVTHRFFAFFLSLVCLAGLWVTLLVSLLAK